MAEPQLTHLDPAGRAVMVDVGHKPPLARRAVATGAVRAGAAALRAMSAGAVPKGDVAAVARIAGIMAAKRTAEIIPLCHPLPLDQVTVDVTVDPAAGLVRITAMAATTARTGVEMEALTAVSAAALTVYDMLKGVDKDLEITSIRLVEKEKGPATDG